MEIRKNDHISLSLDQSCQSALKEADNRFYYEPMLSGHHQEKSSFLFGGKILGLPLWVTSMTGGSTKAREINRVLAKASAKYKIGMGLGSCRSLLDSNNRFEDFNLRPILGKDLPFWGNIGICQVEELLLAGKEGKLESLVERLDLDGLIIHVNPLQEFIQPEGDRLQRSAIAIIADVLERVHVAIMVKEVGQGIGPKSLEKLVQLPLFGIEFGSFGGTNFTQIEMARSGDNRFSSLAKIGHTAYEMVSFLEKIYKYDEKSFLCKRFIVSGGLRDYLDGHYFYTRLKNLNSDFEVLYGHGREFLQRAIESEQELCNFIEGQKNGFHMASNFLGIRA